MFMLQLVFCLKKSLCFQINWQGQIMKEVLWNEMQFKIKAEVSQDIKWTEFHLLLKNKKQKA